MEEARELGGRAARERGPTVYADGLVPRFDGIAIRGGEREGEAQRGQEEAQGAREAGREDGMQEEALEREWHEKGEAARGGDRGQSLSIQLPGPSFVEALRKSDGCKR